MSTSTNARTARSNPVAAAADLARHSARAAVYYGLNRLTSRIAKRQLADVTPFKPTRPVPTERAMLAEVWNLLKSDAQLVRDGICLAPRPASPADLATPLEWLGRVREMVADVPAVARRYKERDGHEVVRDAPTAELAGDLPDYYRQNFHFQTGGYLTEGSARVYDVQVETLFMGTAMLMRRQALRPIAKHIHGRDQRTMQLCDVACGTGHFLGEVLEAFPRLNVTGVDLSDEYLDEARRQLRHRHGVTLNLGNAEALPLPDASQDIVTCVFLFHELPHGVRRQVVAEFARVLKPGGLLVFIDSLQWSDKPEWAGLLEAFPVRFHEPYYRNYLDDDLDALFAGAGLAASGHWNAFMSKIVVRKKVG